MDLRLQGKTALVTGGSKGIGKCTVRNLAEEGCDVAIMARDMAAAEEAANEIARATNRKVIAVRADTSDETQVKAAVGHVMAAFGKIDILVNCAAKAAGQSKPPSLLEVTNDEFFGEMNVKVMGYLRTIQAVAPQMKANGWGRIINVSGMAARTTGSIVGTVRNVSVAALTKNVADELAGTGITVTCVHPGMTVTEKTPGLIERQAKANNITPAEMEKRMDSRNVNRKVVHMQEVADLITFLASPRSVAINGDVVAANGGAPGSVHY
jgi:NAD(P)-dependent dehydrogenase (short-subunit alcohol dehydrogenase family)